MLYLPTMKSGPSGYEAILEVRRHFPVFLFTTLKPNSFKIKMRGSNSTESGK